MLYVIAACGGFALGVLLMCLLRLGIIDAMRGQHEAECKKCHDKLESLDKEWGRFDKSYGV